MTLIEKVPKARKYEKFRSINTLKVCEKIMERIQLEKFIEYHGILSIQQSGFRSIHVKLQ